MYIGQNVTIVPGDIHVCSIIKTMKLGKACGSYGLSSEHFIYAENPYIYC